MSDKTKKDQTKKANITEIKNNNVNQLSKKHQEAILQKQYADKLPIPLSDMTKLQLENLKLKLDIQNLNKMHIEKDIITITENINKTIHDLIDELNIPPEYRLDFNSFSFIIPQPQ